MRSGETVTQPLGQRDLAAVAYWAHAVRGVPIRLRRRGVDFGWLRPAAAPCRPPRLTAARIRYYRALWQRPHPIVLPGVLATALGRFRADIRRSLTFLDRVRASGSAVEWLEREPYASRLQDRFEIVCSVMDGGDARELEKIYVDAVAGTRRPARDLFIKANYLSLHDDDVSLRMRFSFGEEHFADWRAWARERQRSAWSARLALSIFPESRLLAQNPRLHRVLERIIGHRVIFPERIVYSNAPGGGALFHHDFVPTHVGVIFAQLDGITGWLVCPKNRLVAALQHFLQAPAYQRSWQAQFPSRRARAHVAQMAGRAAALAEELESDAEGPLSALINNNRDFIGYLIHLGALRILRPGDVILLPAPARKTATWHSVFCLNDRPGLSLSFAMQKKRVKP